MYDRLHADATKLRKHPVCALRNVAGEALARLQGKTFQKARCRFELRGL